jgi:hypothetical protein
LESKDSVARFQRNARISLPVLVIISLIFQGWGFAVSVLLGGLLADINFTLMKEAVDKILTGLQDFSSRRLIIGFLLRIVLILLGLFAMIHFSFFRLLGALLGASIFVLSGFIEATIVLFRRQY